MNILQLVKETVKAIVKEVISRKLKTIADFTKGCITSDELLREIDNSASEVYDELTTKDDSKP